VLRITPDILLHDEELEWQAIRAQGAGGQNVNKVSSAVHLRFDIGGSSLPEALKKRLLRLRDSRITADGAVVIKAQEHRSQEQNRAAALERLRALIAQAAQPARPRVPTRPSRACAERRLDAKTRRGRLKVLRGRPDE
jgi:ribosome-associated protein